MRNFMEAYAAVHNTEAKEALTSGRDEITMMNLSSLTQSDLDEIVESVLEIMFQKGYSVNSAHSIFSEMFVESNIAGRQEKIDRLCESLNKVFEVIDSKASTIALEEFNNYRQNKKLQESWSARFNQEKRVERTHSHLVAQESLNVKTLLLQLVEKADKSYLETDMKKRQANNEKARKDMEKMGTSMKNPHFEEVSQIRKGWGDAYASIYEKKLDPVGQEDGDVDNDGDKDSSDEYLMKRRKAIGKTMGKKDMKEGVRDMDPEKGTAERKARLEKKRGMKLDDHPQYKKEAFAFSEEDFEELDLFGEEIDAMTDEQLIDMMEDFILETAEDDQDLIEICEHLEGVEMLAEDYYDSAVKSSKAASKTPEAKAGRRKLRMQRLKSAAKGAAKKVGAAAKAAAAKAKPAAKAAAKGAVRGAGYAAGLAKRAAASAKSEFKKGKERGEKGSGGGSSSSSSSSSSSDDGTDGKLDSVLSSIRKSKGSSSGSGGGESSSGGGEKKKPGLLRRIGGAVKRGLKKAAGKTARAVSSGSGKLAKRLGEDYDQIAHLYESGLFSIEEIENVIDESMKQARKNVGADKCWDGYKAKGTKKKNGKVVPNCEKV